MRPIRAAAGPNGYNWISLGNMTSALNSIYQNIFQGKHNFNGMKKDIETYLPKVATRAIDEALEGTGIEDISGSPTLCAIDDIISLCDEFKRFFSQYGGVFDELGELCDEMVRLSDEYERSPDKHDLEL